MPRNTGRYQFYYSKIHEELGTLRTTYSYKTDSLAFAHWFFSKQVGLDETEIGESLIDGSNDNGVDGIVFDEENNEMSLYQFKFPGTPANIGKELDQATVLKLLYGYNKLTSASRIGKTNSAFRDYWQIVKSKNIFSYKLVFVAFLNGLGEHAKEVLDQKVDEIKGQTGNNISYQVFSIADICNLSEEGQHHTTSPIDLKYRKLDTSYNLPNKANSWTGFATAKEILSACKDSMDTIFDENIRLFEGKDNPANKGIQKTAMGEDSPSFFFFHNGIVFICDKCNNSTGNQVVKLTSPAIVNGCQTINILKDLEDKSELKDDVYLPIRIIETKDFDLRSKITEYLNTQTEIRDSYFLANNSIVRDLQEQLLRRGYFLERLVHEYDYKRNLRLIDEFDPSKRLVLEKTIQHFVGYANNQKAADAKRGKGELFNQETIDQLISSITADSVIETEEWYQKIAKAISRYRKSKRAADNLFLEYVDIHVAETDRNELQDKMKLFQFMTTADILLLNAVSNLKRKIPMADPDSYIKKAIIICKDVIANTRDYPSAATKNRQVFEQVQKYIEENF
jgi:hypothetical protein